MTYKTAKTTLGDGLKWEDGKDYSRKDVTVASGSTVSCLEVVGQQQFSVPTSGTAGSNTGDGTCDSVTGGAETKIGTYTLTCTAAATDGGTFSVTDPDGDALADAAVGTAYESDQITFTLTDGTTDFAAGDTFTIAVTAGEGNVVPLDLDATDGSQVAAGFMIADVDASSAATAGVIIARDSMVAMDNLVWPDSITDDQKTAAIAQLEALGIIAVGLA